MDGKRIAEARRAKKMSQSKLGEIIGVSQQSISKYESKTGDIDGETLVAISSALGVTVSYLLGLTDEKGPSHLDGVYEIKSNETMYSVGSLTSDEQYLVELYRECTPEYRGMLIRSAQSFRDSSQVSVEGSESLDDVVNI